MALPIHNIASFFIFVDEKMYTTTSEEFFYGI